MTFASPSDLVQAIAAGRPVILMDDEDRENEGDFVIAAQHCTPSMIAMMAKQGSGLICLALAPEIADRLRLPLIGARDNLHHDTGFLMPIEAKTGVTTGISAADRARTIAVAIDPASTPDDLATPGHIFPLRAHAGGLAARRGHTEAAVYLAAQAGLSPAAVICEILNDDGTMARGDDLARLAARLGLLVGTVDSLVHSMKQRAA